MHATAEVMSTVKESELDRGSYRGPMPPRSAMRNGSNLSAYERAVLSALLAPDIALYRAVLKQHGWPTTPLPWEGRGGEQRDV